jgi:hypothetical protein
VANFEQGFHVIGEIPMEDGVGIGFGLSVLILVSVLASFRRGKEVPAGQRNGLKEVTIPVQWRWLVLLAPWGSLLAYGIKSGIVDAPRLISPYYTLLLPSLLMGARQAEIIRRRWWRVMVWGVLLLAVPVIVMIPGRPLWPARSLLAKVLSVKPGQRLVARALEVYTVYGERWDSLAEVRALLPKGLTVVGFLGHGDDIDISLWRPFLARRVEHILLEDTPEQIRQRRVQYAVVSGGYLAAQGIPLAAWRERTGAELLATVTATQTVIQGPQPWYLVRFKE